MLFERTLYSHIILLKVSQKNMHNKKKSDLAATGSSSPPTIKMPLLIGWTCHGGRVIKLGMKQLCGGGVLILYQSKSKLPLRLDAEPI